MSSVMIPTGYRSVLSIYETQTAIGLLKRAFEDRLSAALNLKRVSAPLFVDPRTGLNDDLNGVERAVSFDVAQTGDLAEIVHSLAKWKRLALHQYGFAPGEGLYTDMNAIRRDDEMDNLHSIYVDQWDWERVIEAQDRSDTFLRETVRKIALAITDTHALIKDRFPALSRHLNPEVSFITAQELLDRYPALSPEDREDAYLREVGTAFVSGIGGALSDGKRHGGRAPDYDDWSLNGDLLFWDDLLGRTIEISSMGIRVDRLTLDRQLTLAGCDARRGLTYHTMLLRDELPQTIGGGIGQSRLCMLLLEKAHIGEVQVSLWDEATRQACQASGVTLL